MFGVRPPELDALYHLWPSALKFHPDPEPGEPLKKERMKRLRTVVQEYNVYRWAAELITELAKSF